MNPQFTSFLTITIRAMLLVALGISLTNCAKPASPSGGPRDKEPAKVVRTYPENQSLYFAESTVKFYFDEAIKVGSYGKEIFISPLPSKKPKIRLSDSAKRLSIIFDEALRPQTTYVITLTEIADFNAGNKMTEAYTLAFSTGDQLDSLKIEGKILLPMLGQTAKEMTVMLFDADSVVNNDLFRKSPAYITKPNGQGVFTFEYLRNTNYRVFGIEDKDQTNTYSQPSERLAVGLDTIIQFPEDSSIVRGVELYSFIADGQPPLFQNYVWLSNRTLLLGFSENLRLDELEGYVADTLNQNANPLDQFTWFPNPEPELLVHSPRGRFLPSQISLLSVYDSLGNRTDTLFPVASRRFRELTAPILNQPEWQEEAEYWKLISYRLWEEQDSSLIFLTDTNQVDSLQKRFAVQVEANAFELVVQPKGKLPPNQYWLNIAGSYFSPADSMDTDTTYRYLVDLPDPEKLGTLSGTVRLDSPFVGPIVLELWADKTQYRSTNDTAFYFRNLQPKTYFVRVILDTDSNGVWTTGALWPPKMPERIFEDRSEIAIRENWDFEEHEVIVRLPEIQVADSTQVEGDASADSE